jgi:penicillin-binding protein 1A
MMNAMMRRTVVDGTATKAGFDWPSAGKTGTSQKSRDAWFVGYTANLTTGVWFGNDDGAPMKKVTGGALPALAWHEFMVAAHEGVPVAQLPGGWKSPRGGIVPPDPLIGVGDEDPVASLPEPPAEVGQAEPPKPVRRVSASQDETASIERPVPPGEVGGKRKTREVSILDVILGN